MREISPGATTDDDPVHRTSHIPVILEMHQANSGDLLRIVRGTSSVIFDSGTTSQMDQLAQMLQTHYCEMLVLTHLDADHYGGLRALIQKWMSGRAVQWPRRIVVNDFEPRESVAAVLFAIGENGLDREPAKIIDEVIEAGARWSEGAHNHSDRRERSEDLGDFEARHVVEVDRDAFWYLYEVAAKFGELPRWQSRRSSDLQVLSFFLDEGRVLVMSGPASPPGIRISRSSGIDSDLPIAIRAIRHLAENGPELLRKYVREDASFLPLIEAIHHLPGVEIIGARSGQRFDVLNGALELLVVGPDEKELEFLRRSWKTVRDRGRIHVGRYYLAFVEATVFMALHERQRLDSSSTNRSSIQVVAQTGDSYAVLTGDGRPDTIERALSMFPRGECRVFKAAHHGSANNILTHQDPNTILNRLKPKQIWISAGDRKHPAPGFLAYLHHLQRPDSPFEICVTNANENVDAIRGRLNIRIMSDDGPETCEL
jgi:hypothetical protein